MSFNINVQALDSQGNVSDADKARMAAELVDHLPALIDMLGVHVFHAIIRQIWDIVPRAPGGAIMIEKNTAKDGAFLYIGSHSFDVVAALRRELGMEGLADKELPAATAKVRARREREAN